MTTSAIVPFDSANYAQATLAALNMVARLQPGFLRREMVPILVDLFPERPALIAIVEILTAHPVSLGLRRQNSMHRWEILGLGKAPFRCLGCQTLPSPALLGANPTAYNNAMGCLDHSYHLGTCAVCGAALVNNYAIESRDGQRFSVGCDCVAKTGDRGLVNKVKALARVQAREAREAKRQAKWAAEQQKREAALDVERQRNGGLTDAEIAERERLAARRARVAELAPLAARLADGRGGFRDSVASDMTNLGKPPFGRGRDITLEILARSCGRKGSKGFEAEAERLSVWFTEFDQRHGI